MGKFQLLDRFDQRPAVFNLPHPDPLAVQELGFLEGILDAGLGGRMGLAAQVDERHVDRHERPRGAAAGQQQHHWCQIPWTRTAGAPHER